MSILKDLYNGKIYPFETVVPQDEEYYPLSKEIAEERQYLQSKLPDGDKERLEKYDNMVYQTEIMLNYAYFEEGFRLGAMLLYESLIEKRGNQSQKDAREGAEGCLADILADQRLSGIFEKLLSEDENYQQSLKLQEEANEGIESVRLNAEQEKAVDRLVSAVNHCGAMYGAAAYKRGLKDGAKLSAELRM